MISFLCWNLNGKTLTDSIVRLARKHEADVIALIECATPSDEVQRALDSRAFHFHSGKSKRFKVYSRFGIDAMKPDFNDGLRDRLLVYRLNLPNRPELLIAILHMPSKASFSDADQLTESSIYARDIADREMNAGHQRTVVFGDFNMNPFDSGMSGGFGSVMTREIASRRVRKVQFKEYPYFYNPMWGRFGDTTRGPAGTHYFDAAGTHVNSYWHMLDQVLIRPELLPYFDHNDLDILDTDGETKLVEEDGRPSQSDHLPLLFRLSI